MLGQAVFGLDLSAGKKFWLVRWYKEIANCLNYDINIILAMEG